PSSWHKITTTLEISLITANGYKSRHSQPECGYALEPSKWTEYSIHTMDPDNLELTFEFFEEDLSEHVVQGDVHPGHVGTACLLSSSFQESGKDTGVATLPIMGRNSRQTIGKVRDLLDDEDEIDEHQPFPSLSQDGTWDGNLSSYFNMNTFLDIILNCVLQKAGKRRIIFSCFDPDICTMVRLKQNKYPILFLTQGVSEKYPELMDIRCQTTQIAISFAQSENILGISAHTEELLKHLNYIREAQSKGLVVFSWGDDNNEHENRRKLREQGIDGLIYDR
ncbi:hypothetical protein GOODEAATRI_022897, partial [Goodea atripinnis]